MRFFIRSQLYKWTVKVLTHWKNRSFSEEGRGSGSLNARTIFYSYSLFRVIVPLTIHYHCLKSEQQHKEQLISLTAYLHTNVQLIWRMTVRPNLWQWWLKLLARRLMMLCVISARFKVSRSQHISWVIQMHVDGGMWSFNRCNWLWLGVAAQETLWPGVRWWGG